MQYKPENASKDTFLQELDGTGGKTAGSLNVLKVSSGNTTKELFITVIEAYPAGGLPEILPSVAVSKKDNILELRSDNKVKKFRISADRKNKNTPLFTEVK